MNIRVTTAILLGGLLMMSIVFTTGFCVIGAGVLIALAIHLRRR